MKKTLAAFLAILMVSCSAAVTGFAEEPAGITYYEVDGRVLISDDASPFPAPRMKYLNSVSAGIGRSGSLATCTGTITIFTDYEVKIIVALERSTDGSKWTKVTSWPGRATAQGIEIVENTYTLTRGFQYRVKTTATVVDSSNVGLETVSAISDTEYYL